MFANGPFRLRTIVNFVSNVWPFNSRSQRGSSESRPEKPDTTQSVIGESASREEKFSRAVSFWNYSGSYVGYRISDGLFHMDGHQIGYFAEGNEIYGCHGRYLGEVHGLDRLITNLSKKAWRRTISAPRALQHSAGHRDLTPMGMRPGYEDFPVAS
jgi:hypothetical protein